MRIERVEAVGVFEVEEEEEWIPKYMRDGKENCYGVFFCVIRKSTALKTTLVSFYT